MRHRSEKKRGAIETEERRDRGARKTNEYDRQRSERESGTRETEKQERQRSERDR